MGKDRLDYLLTENWHTSRLRARGALNSALQAKKTVVVGVGALGSAIAELLVRGGVRDLHIVDGDSLAIGNLVRHTLTVRELNEPKSKAVAERLRLAAPLSNITSLDVNLPAETKELQKFLNDFEVVIDCTAENGVLIDLGSAWWAIPKLFISASLGFAAKRVYLYSAVDNRFPVEDFLGSVEPYLQIDRETWAEMGETREGNGCWSPVFPAHYHDILAAAAACVRLIQRQFEIDGSSGLKVFQRSNDHLSGYSLI